MRPSTSRFGSEEVQPQQGSNAPLMTPYSFGYGQPAIPTIPNHAAHRTERYRKLWLLFDLFCFAWIVPIVFALYFNFSRFIVGAGVGCKVPSPSELCFPDLLRVNVNETTTRHGRLNELNKEDRVVLNILQFVAKALEDWFVIIASSIIFSMTMRLATTNKGIPLGYLLSHVSVADLTMLFDRTFWTSLTTSRRPGIRIRVFWFVLVVVALCIACNLMGPATAVLLIPQLMWRTIPMPDTQRFESIFLSQPPTSTMIPDWCQDEYVSAGNYSCTILYSASLDELSSGWRLRTEFMHRGWAPLPVMTEYLGLLYTINSTLGNTTFNASSDTDPDWAIWVPLRQSLREVAADYIEVQASQDTWPNPEDEARMLAGVRRERNESLFSHYRNALDIVLHRKAPSVGFNSLCFRATGRNNQLSDTKAVRCYSIPGVQGLVGIVCFPLGDGWETARSLHSHLVIEDIDTQFPGYLYVDTYAMTYSTGVENSTVPCGRLATGNASQLELCDWETIFFLSPGYHEDVLVYSLPTQIVEYSIPMPTGENHTVVCSDQFFVDHLDYFISVSPDQNFAGIVQLETPATLSHPFSCHPDWMLASWSVDQPSGVVEGSRPAAVNLVSALKNVGTEPPPQSPDGSLTDFYLSLVATLHYTSVMHGMTFVDYTTTNITTNLTDDANQPILRVSKSLRVWSYDCETRTFKFAAAVAIFGCVVAFLRPLASLLVKTRRPSTLHILTAALQRPPLESLYGKHKDTDIGRVSLRVVPYEEHDEMVALQEIIPQPAVEMRQWSQ